MPELPQLADILESLPQWQEDIRSQREIVLANAVMFGEIPAPTFGEEKRVRFLSDRFTESGLDSISVDEIGNGTAILPGSTGKRNILVSAHVDTRFEASVDHTVTVDSGSLRGPGIADNALGLAAVGSLAEILQATGVKLKSNLVLLGAVRSLGKGDLAGLRFFVENASMPLHAAVCVEGIHLGRLSYNSLGMLRGEITVTAPDRLARHSRGGGAISSIAQIVDRMLALPRPEVPRTSIILGSVLAGNGFNVPPTHARLRFEVRSEQAGMVASLKDQIEEIVREVHAESDTTASLEILARRRPGGVGFSHPLVRATREVMEKLGVNPETAPSVGDLSAVIAHEIPGVTLGLTEGQRSLEQDEIVQIEPLFDGLTQLVAVLAAIDEGICDEEN